MTPMEAWANISDRLKFARWCKHAVDGGNGFTDEDIEAEVMVFGALKMLDKKERRKEQNHD